MKSSESRRDMLNQFIGLARVYRGWSKGQLAAALDRDPTKLVPETGNPKLDLVVRLAGVLDWPVGDVAEGIWVSESRSQSSGNDPTEAHFAELDRLALDAHRSGDHAAMVSIAGRMAAIAETSQQRAIAANREAGGWDGMGRFTKVLEAVQRGLHEQPITTPLRLMLQANLANAHYTLWHLVEARAVARDLLDHFEECPPTTRLERVTHAFAHYVRGNATRRMLDSDPSSAARTAGRAKMDLERAMHMYEALASEFSDESYSGVANTCRGAIIETDVALELRTPTAAAEELSQGLDKVVDTESFPVGDWLESYGWWCIYGCNIALRGLDGRDLHRHMAVFTNKAAEIADRTNNWSMREQVFTLEHFRRQRVADATGFDPDWLIDEDEVRVIAGTMGRFPHFRQTGWRILQAARILDEN
ncbi:MAG: hypothetical protein KDA22_12855 [Phycisphaerales bacterium]|nr:hypothetical protein [Phycisphaerales bacterium]